MSRTNYCFIVGNLGSEPVERGRTEKAGPIVGFPIAENVQAFDTNSKQFNTIHTNWFQVTAFGQIAEKAKRGLHKGDRVAVHGKLKVSKYKSKTGEDRTSVEIIADEVGLWKSLPSSASTSKEEEVETDDIPF